MKNPKKFKSIPCWHIHHKILLEWLTEPIENRIAHIEMWKPEEEIPTRLRLLKPVRGKLPKGVIKAWEACLAKRGFKNKSIVWAEYNYNTVEQARCDAMLVYLSALDTFQKTLTMKSVLKLHEKECPNCPWDGKTIFP